MAEKFSELRSSMSPAAQERSDAAAKVMLADILHVQLPYIAEIEKRTDMHLSTLRSHVQAMDGKLHIIVRSPDRAVQINNFTDLGTVDSF